MIKFISIIVKIVISAVMIVSVNIPLLILSLIYLNDNYNVFGDSVLKEIWEE